MTDDDGDDLPDRIMVRVIGPSLINTDNPSTDEEFQVGAADEGQVWCALYSDDGAERQAHEVDFDDDPDGHATAWRASMRLRRVVVGVGDPDDGGTQIRMPSATAIRLARSILSAATLTFPPIDDDFGFISHTLGLPWRATDADDTERGVVFDPEFAAFIRATGSEPGEINGYEWARVYAAWMTSRETRAGDRPAEEGTL